MTSARKLNVGLVGGGVISVDITEPFNFQQQVSTIRSAGYMLSESVYVTADAIQWMAIAAPENPAPFYMGTKQ